MWPWLHLLPFHPGLGYPHHGHSPTENHQRRWAVVCFSQRCAHEGSVDGSSRSRLAGGTSPLSTAWCLFSLPVYWQCGKKTCLQKIASAIPQDPRLLQVTAGEGLALFHSPISLLSLTEASLQVARNRIALLLKPTWAWSSRALMAYKQSFTSLSYPTVSGRLYKQLLSTFFEQASLLKGIVAKRRK